MKPVNVWLALRKDAFDILRPLLEDSEYDGQHLTAVKIFRRMIHHSSVDRMWKSPTIDGNQWKLFSLTFKGVNRGKIKDALDYLEANYPSKFEVLGAWEWDGRQVGTEIVDGEVTGAPVYPVHPQLIKFMPDVWDNSDPENPVLVPATELTDVRHIQGQSLRRFS